jgi:hypothetical protein
MEGHVLTHLSVEDINVYLLGKPETSQRTNIEEHCRNCPQCLEQICALAARIDESQLAHQPVPAPIPEVSLRYISSLENVVQPWQSWAAKAVAAGLIFLVTPNSARLVRFDYLFDSPLNISAMNLPFTREVPTALALMGAPNVEFVEERRTEEPAFRPIAYRRFQAPETDRRVQLVEVALIEAPNLKFTDSSIGPPPVELDVVPAVYHSKPGMLRRFFSAIISPFRSPGN